MSLVPDHDYFLRETVQSFGKGEGKQIRSHGGRGVYAHVDVAVRPTKPGSGLRVTWECGLDIPARFAGAVVEGIHDALRAGVLSGVEMVDVHASVENGSYHDVDSTAEAFREAAQEATTEALRQAAPVLLQALAQFSFNVPSELLAVVNELAASFGGRIHKTCSTNQEVAIEVQIPAPLGFEFMARIVETSNGQSTVSMAFTGYEIKPEPPDTMESWVRTRS